MSIEKEHNELSRIPKVDPSEQFPVPDSYFQTFPAQILQKVKKEEGGGKVISLFTVVKYAVSIAAIFLGVVLISNYFQDGSGSLNSVNEATEIAYSEELSEEDLALLAANLDEVDLIEEVSAEDKEVIEEYLIEQNDITSIINEL